MLEIEGRSFKKIDVPELRDVIFYGQRKVYDGDVPESVKKAIASKGVVVISGSIPQDSTSMALPVVVISDEANSEIERLRRENLAKDDEARELRRKLEDNDRANRLPPQAAPVPVLDVDKLVAVISDRLLTPTHPIQPAPAPSISHEASKPDASPVFIPSVVVTDMSNNLNLKSKVISGGGSVNKAADALRKARGS